MPGSSPSLLDLDALIAALGPSACRFDVDAVAECDSTNSRLLDKATRGAPSGSGTSGEGRHCMPADGPKPPVWAKDTFGKPLGACPQETRCNERGYCVRLET